MIPVNNTIIYTPLSSEVSELDKKIDAFHTRLGKIEATIEFGKKELDEIEKILWGKLPPAELLKNAEICNRQKEFDKALQLVDRALQIKDLPNEMKALFRCQEATAFNALSEFEKALAAIQLAPDMKSVSEDYRGLLSYQKVYAYIRKEEYEKALAEIEESLKWQGLKPNTKNYLLYLKAFALSQSTEKKKLKTALKIARKTLASSDSLSVKLREGFSSICKDLEDRLKMMGVTNKKRRFPFNDEIILSERNSKK